MGAWCSLCWPIARIVISWLVAGSGMIFLTMREAENFRVFQIPLRSWNGTMCRCALCKQAFQKFPIQRNSYCLPRYYTNVRGRSKNVCVVLRYFPVIPSERTFIVTHFTADYARLVSSYWGYTESHGTQYSSPDRTLSSSRILLLALKFIEIGWNSRERLQKFRFR